MAAPARKRPARKLARKGASRSTLKAVPVESPPSPGRSPDFRADDTIKTMPNEHLQCRDFGHSWRPFTATWESSDRYYEVQLRCARCKTVRIRLVGQRGQLIRSRYDYADGYVVKGMGRLDGDERDMLRLESVLRILPDDVARDED